MVKIVDGFREDEETRKRGNSIAELIISIFGPDRISHPFYNEDSIIILGEDRSSRAARVNCWLRVILVNEEKYYPDCLRLAEESEKALGEEFTLRTQYQR